MRWYNLADRMRPVALFQLGRSPHLKSVILRALCHLRQISGKRINDATLAWAREAAYELSAEGTIGLGALLKSISSPEVRQWFLHTQNDPEDLGALIGMLAWVLRFPAVYALSEGSNHSNLYKDLCEKPVIWIECRTEHFEITEYSLITALLSIAVQNALKHCRYDRKNGQSNRFSIVHLFPPSHVFQRIPKWVEEHIPGVRHVTAHRMPMILSFWEKAVKIPKEHSKFLKKGFSTRCI